MPSRSWDANGNELSLFRRPLPTTNLAFLSTIMWDGRETHQKGSAAAIHFDLTAQANRATEGHAEAAVPVSQSDREAIVAYQMGLFTAQVYDRRAGSLTAAGAAGGPDVLATQPFVFGVNDPLGCDPSGAQCTGVNAPHPHHRSRRDQRRFEVVAVPGTCTTCHDTPHARDHSVPAPLARSSPASGRTLAA